MLSLKEIEEKAEARQKMVREIKAIEGFAAKNTRVREVLDEETFVEGLERIITRDYYPDLWKIQEYKKWKEEAKHSVLISDLLSNKTREDSSLRKTFEKDTDKMTLAQYVTKYTSEDNNSLDMIMEKDRERYLEKYAWIFQPHQQALEKNKALQAESDNKLRNMLEGSSAGALMFSASDPMSKFIFNPITPALESYSEPFSHCQKMIVKENTRLPEFMKPPARPVLHNAKPRQEHGLGKRDFFTLSTPNLLGIRDKDAHSQTPFNLKQLLGERDGSDEEEDAPGEQRQGGFEPLRFPSPSPSQLDSPLMTWGEVESEPVKLGPHSLRVAFEENPREKLAHQLANAYLEKGRFKTQKKEAQIQKMLTPYARRFAEGPSSGLMSSISSRLIPRAQSSIRRSILNTPKGNAK